MEKKNKKDIVDQIIERMKSTDELPYKEGSWENFQRRYDPVIQKRSKTFYWAASAAAILLLGIFAVKNWPSEDSLQNPEIANQSVGKKSDVDVFTPKLNDNEDLKSESNSGSILSSEAQSNLHETKGLLSDVNRSLGESRSDQSLDFIHSDVTLAFSQNSIQLPSSLNAYSFSIQKANVETNNDYSIIRENNINTELALNVERVKRGQEPELKDRKFYLKDKFDLGLFVSPNSTDERFNFGGGILLAYNISKNISVRTGLAYNRYDVSVLKDPTANPETPIVASQDAIQRITASGLTQQYMSSNAIVLPNVNAISGNVQAFEVPLDIRVKSKDGFYASSGITYAAVFNQNRYAHYVENANSEVFGDGLPENEADAKSAVQQVSRAIKTEDENVNSNGFGGFVNFSIGKEMKMNKRMNISVEPYLKLPVGSFKRADMNYTNGGIRIITNF